MLDSVAVKKYQLCGGETNGKLMERRHTPQLHTLPSVLLICLSGHQFQMEERMAQGKPTFNYIQKYL